MRPPLLLLVIFCCRCMAVDFKTDFFAKVAALEDEMAILEFEFVASDNDEWSLSSAIRLVVNEWWQFGDNMRTVLMRDDGVPELLAILLKIELQVEYTPVSTFLMASHKRANLDALNVTSTEYQQIAGHVTALSQHFDQLVSLTAAVVDKHHDKDHVIGGEKWTKRVDDLFQDIVKDVDEVSYFIMDRLPMTHELQQIDGYGNTKTDLDTSLASLTKWTSDDPEKERIAALLVPLVEILRKVGQRIEALRAMSDKSRKVDWILSLLYTENAFRYQAGSCEVLFIAQYLDEMSGEHMPGLDEIDGGEFAKETSAIGRSFNDLDSLLEEIITRFEDRAENGVDVRMAWWDRFFKLNGNGRIMQQLFEKIIKTLPPLRRAHYFEHYSAASVNFRPYLGDILNKLSFNYRQKIAAASPAAEAVVEEEADAETLRVEEEFLFEL